MQPFVPRLGGKSRISKKIVKRFPTHETYIEPFVGGGSVLLIKNPSINEVINDKDKELYILWKGMKKIGEKLSTFSFKPNKTLFDKLKKSKPSSMLKQMYRTLYVFKHSFGGLGRNFASKGVSGIRLKKNLLKYKNRLKDVTILNKDWKTVVKKYDSANSFYYMDPPYETGNTKQWNYKPFTAVNLIPTLKKLQGKFLLSFENSTKNKQLFKNAGFKINTITTQYGIQPNKPHIKKIELLVRNY